MPSLRYIVLLMFGLSGCDLGTDSENDYRKIEGEIFGTHYRITYLGAQAPETVQTEIERKLEAIDWMASTWKPESELMRYNRAPDRSAFERSPELVELMEQSARIKEWTGGAFDIDYNKTGQLDLSAIAKGYAVDQICDLLDRKFEMASYLVDIGGEIKVRGPGPNGADWHVGIYLPALDTNHAIQTPRLKLRDSSIATSGTSFKGDHMIDPESGKAARPPLISVSVIHPSNSTADALATALFVMGPEKGMTWAKENEIPVIFILKDGSVIEHRPE